MLDVLVVGGGPAGAAVAALLATWGHSVLVLDRPNPRPALAESLPPSCTRLLEVIGVYERVASAGFIAATGNTVWWGGDERRVEHFPGGRTGWQVERSHFDEVMRAHAMACGAQWLRPATARSLAAADDMVECAADVEGRSQVFHARWAVDATGRTGLTARRRRVGSGSAWRTTALAAEWKRAGGWGLPDESHTLVESVGSGWGWSVPGDAERRFFTVMFNPADGRPESEALDADYRRRLELLPALGALAASGTCIGAAFACDASTYHAGTPVDDRVLSVGDAASFLDPLSSFGVKKALASGWTAAVALHTALTTPDARVMALEWFARREGEYVKAAKAPLGALSREVASTGAGAFWGTRASLEGDEAHADLVETLRNDPAVLRAFAELRRREPAVLRTAVLRTVPGPVVRGNVVVVEPHLDLPVVGAPLRYLRNVDLLQLAEMARGGTEVGALCADYESRFGRTPLPDLLGAISVLLAHEVVAFA